MKFTWRLLFLSVGGSGLSPIASGTVGSLVALPFGIAILMLFSPLTLALLSVLISIIAIRQIDIYEKDSGIHDSGKIVIDELVGMWLALSLAPGSIITFENLINFRDPIFQQIILSFFLFRLFDIWKPSLIGKIDRNVDGGLGVMGDDILAGIGAGLLSSLTIYLINIINGVIL